MPYVLIIDTKCSIKEQNIKNVETNELYKKCGFKTSKSFKEHHRWKEIENNGDSYSDIVIYGKTESSTGKENQYELPPPIDKALFFGKIMIMGYRNGIPCDLRKDQWERIYENLMGGFESLENSDIDDEEEEEEEEEIDPSLLDKNGYLKDGFIAEDDEEEDIDFESELSEEEYFN